MASSQLLVIVVVAMIAGVILFRLYSVLGRRTGNEREPRQRFSRWGRAQGPSPDNLVALPDRSPASRQDSAPKPFDELERTLMDIKLADRTFETDRFLSGAKKAHELITTAFAKGDRDALRSLLSGEVFAAFDQVLKERERQHHSVKFALVGYKSVKITHASLNQRTAEITVAFLVQAISSTTDAQGTLIEGDPAAVRDMTDIWTFARDVGGRDPNWTLVATSGGEG